MRTMLQIFLLIILISSLMFCSEEELPFPVVEYGCETIVDYEVVFPDSVILPADLSLNINSNEIYVLNKDQAKMTRSVSVFTNNGSHLEDIEIMNVGRDSYLANSLKCGIDGELIVHSYSSVRVFNREGELKHLWDWEGVSLYLSVNSRNEFLINDFSDSLMIFKYTMDGEPLAAFGRIPNLKIPSKERVIYYMGIPFQTEDSTYYSFQRNSGIVKVFDHKGSQIKEKRLDIPELSELYLHFDTALEERIERAGGSYIFYHNVVYRNNRFYYLYSSIADDKGLIRNVKDKVLFVYELDHDLKILRKIILDNMEFVLDLYNNDPYTGSLARLKFDVDIDGNIYILNDLQSKILKFSPKAGDGH